MGFLGAMGNFFSDVGTDFHDAAVSPFGGDTNAQQEAAQRAAEAAKQAGAERKKLAADNKGLGFDGGFDPASITQHENWQSYSHQQLYDTNQHSIQQGEATEVAHAWRSIAGELKKIGPGLQHEVGTALQDGWEGEAADAAKQAGEPLARWSDEHGEALHMTGNRIEQAASAAGQVKASVPPPQEPSVGRQVAASVLTGPVPGVGAAADGVMQMQQRQEDTRKAQETMGRVMTPTYHNVDTTVPAFKHVNGQPAPPAPAPAPGSPSAPPSSGHGGAAGGGGHTAGGRAGAHSAGGGGAASGHHAGSGGASARTGSASAGPAAPPGHPGGGAPPPQGGGQGAPVEGMMPVPPGAGGAGGAGAGGGGRTGGVGGRAGGAGGAQGAASGSSGAAAGRGGAAGGGMSPGGARGGGDQNEHERPTWLEEHDDVWLNDMPRTAPPVFGA